MPRDPEDPPQPTVVLKFGGTSVSSAARWRTIARIVAARRAEGLHPVVVCSAAGGTSDDLARALAGFDDDPLATTIFHEVRARHVALADALGVDGTAADEVLAAAEARLAAA
ncbi:MAG: hypothetical protein KC656_35175, partial [Myxococcales bacterium]|nr:hypothetical protein [Myxococcales bacterium]